MLGIKGKVGNLGILCEGGGRNPGILREASQGSCLKRAPQQSSSLELLKEASHDLHTTEARISNIVGIGIKVKIRILSGSDGRNSGILIRLLMGASQGS